MRCTVVSIILLLGTVGASWADELSIGRFSAGDLTGWSDKSFSGKTEYFLVNDAEKKVLKAHSRHAASGLVKKLTIDPKKYPLLHWSWKIEHTLMHEDVTKKSGDDFAARVYVVFPRTFFWRMRTITYVWAHKLPKDTPTPSPYTSNAVIIAVESGDEKAGQWVNETRNVREDYRKAFGENPPPIGGIAVMTDTDDTKDEANAWYGDISMTGPSAPAYQ